MSIYVEAKHGIVCSVDEGKEVYFGWPTVAKLADGTIVAGSSGLRAAHVCPWGKSVVCYSKDGGETYGDMIVAHNDMIDNRDLGVVAMGGQKHAITWFSLDSRNYNMDHCVPKEYAQEAKDYIATWNPDTVGSLLGSWMKISEDEGKTWTRAIRVPVNAPHGFSMRKDGALAYLGKGYREDLGGPSGPIQYAESRDGGFTWQIVGEIPLPKAITYFHEPHVIELNDGTLLGVIRYEDYSDGKEELETYITRSEDGGKTWTLAESMNVAGSPPHLLQHSSGAVVMVYGYRHPGYGQRAVVSWDNGKTWSEDIIIRDDGNNGDLGYPASVELDDGSIYTVYYQAKPGRRNTAIMWSRWKLPEKK